MSILNIFTRQAPTIAGYSFDAVLEDTFEATVNVTTYPVESGVRVADHRILNPFKWTMSGAISNNELKTQLTDFLGDFGIARFTFTKGVRHKAGEDNVDVIVVTGAQHNR